MTTKTEVAQERKVENLEISKITPDPNQPRKTFDDRALGELSQSILQLGLLQPITVRPTAKGYAIVMGERRYRASKLANLKTIECIVRDFDSTLISEVQIIENLQRQDVEVIEEAEAISFLLKNHSAEDIAIRIGRTVQFIYGRIKLANLIEGFRVHVRSKALKLTQAIGIAIFSKEEQEELLESMGDRFYSHHIDSAIKNKTFNLDNAPFALDDATLAPKAGACTVCPFNSLNQGSLFGLDKPVCTKISCFTSKKSKSLLVLMEKAKKEGFILVGNFWKNSLQHSEKAQYLFSLMNENGLVPYHKEDVDYLEKPIKQTEEMIKKDNAYNEDYSKEELADDLKEALEGYNEELKEYEQGITDGYVKGLIVSPSEYTTKEVILKFKEADSDNEQTNISVDKKKMEDCTPKEKIVKIDSREERKQHLEANKEFVEIMDAVQESDYIDSKKGLTPNEMVAISITMYESLLGWAIKDKVKGFYGANKVKIIAKKVEAFKKNYNKATYNKMVRMLIIKNVRFGENNHHNDEVNNSAYIALQDFCRKEIEVIEQSYAQSASERADKLKIRKGAILEKS